MTNNNATVCLTLAEIEAAHADAVAEAARTEPKPLAQLEAEERAAHAAYEAKTTAFTVNEIKIVNGQPVQEERAVSIAEARRVFDAALTEGNKKPAQWKDAFTVYVPLALLIITTRAIAFFQGANPVVSDAGAAFRIRATGYAG